MARALIHYGPISRGENVEALLNEHIGKISSHIHPKYGQCEVWLDRIRSHHAKMDVLYECKIEVKVGPHSTFFVEKQDASMEGALIQARRAAMNRLERNLSRRRWHRPEKTQYTA